jgi:hypothetical protein
MRPAARDCGATRGAQEAFAIDRSEGFIRRADLIFPRLASAPQTPPVRA